MKRGVSQEKNRQNLLEVIGLLKDCEYFPFFGTLLGLNRNGDIIPHDDDVDILVNARDRDEVIRRMTSDGSGFQISANSHESFLQIYREIDGEVTFVDFYFYNSADHLDYLVEKWNFFGLPDDPDMQMHIPKDLIFPLVYVEFWGVPIPMPHNPDRCCEYLYGKSWKFPLSKRFGYTVSLVDHIPTLTANPEQISDMILAIEKSEAHLSAISLEIETERAKAHTQIEQAHSQISRMSADLETAHLNLQKAHHILKNPVSNMVRLKLAQFSMSVLPLSCIKARATLTRSIEKRRL